MCSLQTVLFAILLVLILLYSSLLTWIGLSVGTQVNIPFNFQSKVFLTMILFDERFQYAYNTVIVHFKVNDQFVKYELFTNPTDRQLWTDIFVSSLSLFSTAL